DGGVQVRARRDAGRDPAEGTRRGAGADRPVDVEQRRRRRAVRPADLDLVGGRGARGADRRRARSRAGRIEDLGGPDLLARAAAAVGPDGPEGPGDPGQAVVVAELVAVVLPAGRLVGLRRGDLHRGREGDAVVEGGLVVDVDLLARGVGHRVVVHDADPAGRLVDHQPLVELV